MSLITKFTKRKSCVFFKHAIFGLVISFELNLLWCNFVVILVLFSCLTCQHLIGEKFWPHCCALHVEFFLQGTAAPLHYLHFMRSHSHLLFYLSWNTPEYTVVHDNILLELRGFLLFSLHRSRESQTAAISLKCPYIYSTLYGFWSLWLHPQSVFWYVFDLEERSRGERCMLIPFTVITKLSCV